MSKRVHRVGVHEAKTHLSRLLRAIERGDEVVIERGGKPIAKLVREAPPRSSRGMFRGQIKMAEDFDSDAVNDEIADLFGIPK